MGSISIQTVRELYPGRSDIEIAAKIAEEEGYIVVLRYRSRGARDYTDFATCTLSEEVKGYFSSPYCNDVEILYDIRSQALEITSALLLQSKCKICGRPSTQQSLIIGSGNDFYFCPICTNMFCHHCLPNLPLTKYPYGYAKCPDCDVQLQRAFPGAFGNKPCRNKGKQGEAEVKSHSDRSVPLIEQESLYGSFKSKTLWKMDYLPGIGESLTCSEDCLHCGLVRSVGDPKIGFTSEFAVVDGVRYTFYERITPNADLPIVQFSPDGSVWGYSAKQKDRELVVINGRESKHYEELLHPWLTFDLSFSQKGGHFAFGVRNEGKCFLVINGEEMSPFENVENFHWSHSGERYCYTAKIKGNECYIVDGEQGPVYQSVGWLVFSPDDKHFAYTAKTEKGYFVLIDHERIGEVYNDIESITFSPDGKHLAYWIKQGEVFSLFVNGQPMGIWVVPGEIDVHRLGQNWQIEFSPDGSHIAAAGIHRGKQLVLKDGTEVGSYASVGHLMYMNQNQLLYLAEHENKRWSLVVDGKTQDEYPFVCNLVTAAKGNRYAFQVSEKDHYYMVVDGIPTKLKYSPKRDFKYLKFSTDGSRFSYVAAREVNPREHNPNLYVVIDDIENGPYDRVAGTHFAENDVFRFITLRSGMVEIIERHL